MAFLKTPKFDFHLPRKFSGGSGCEELDVAQHQELERLYASTRAGKHFQKDIVKGIENFICVGNKQLELSNKLAEDCRKYCLEGPSVREALARATGQYGSARNKMERERDSFHRSLGTQVAEPLRTMVHGSPLADARHLKQKYDRLREEASNQVSEVNRRKTKDPNKDPDHVAKLHAAEHKLDEITSAMDQMGKSATSAMSVVEYQQQSTSLQKLLAMVDAERAYFQRVTLILDQLHYEIEAEVRRSSNTTVSSNSNGAFPYSQTPESTPTVRKMSVDPPEPSDLSQPTANGDYEEKTGDDRIPYPVDTQSFYAIATINFIGEDKEELSISIGDEVLVRQVTSSGWSEGTCNGQSGWFPSTHVAKKQSMRRGRARSGSGHGSR